MRALDYGPGVWKLDVQVSFGSDRSDFPFVFLLPLICSNASLIFCSSAACPSYAISRNDFAIRGGALEPTFLDWPSPDALVSLGG